jgi:hypothetical protein
MQGIEKMSMNQENLKNASQSKELISFVVDHAIEHLRKQAADKGAIVTKSDLLTAIMHDPEGNVAKRFSELFSIGFSEIVKSQRLVNK